MFAVGGVSDAVVVMGGWVDWVTRGSVDGDIGRGRDVLILGSFPGPFLLLFCRFGVDEKAARCDFCCCCGHVDCAVLCQMFMDCETWVGL